MQWRKERGISRKLFAQMAHFSERKLATYEKTRPIPVKVVRPITETMRLIQALRPLAGDEHALKDWLITPNQAFDQQPPLELIKQGQADQLWEMIHQLRQGSFS